MSTNRRQATVIIYQGDDLDKMGELKQIADRAQWQFDEWKLSENRRTGDAPVDPQPAKDEFDAFVDEAAERATAVKVFHIGRKRFRQLKREHPARMETRLIEGKQSEVTLEEDDENGVNVDTFPDALLMFHDPATDYRTIVEPAFPTKEGLVEFLDEMADGDFEKLWLTAFSLNTAVGADPKLLRFSATTRNSSGTSVLPEA